MRDALTCARRSTARIPVDGRPVAGLAALVLAVAAAAAEPAPAPTGQPLTFHEVMAAVTESNPAARAAAHRAEAAGGAALSARGAFDPVYGASGYWRVERERQVLPYVYDSKQREWDLTTGIGGTTATGTSYALSAGLNHFYARTTTTQTTDTGEPYDDDTTDEYTSRLDVALTQSLLRGARLAYTLQQVRVADADREAAELEAEAASQEALRAAAAAYWQWTLEEGVAAIEADAQTIAEEDLRVAQVQVDRGTLASAELARRQAQLALTELTAQQARLAAETAEDVVQAAMGEDPAIDRVPATQPGEAVAMDLDPARVQEAATSGNPRLAAVTKAADARSLAQRAARSGRMADLSVTAMAGVAAVDAGVGQSVAALGEDTNLPYFQVGADFAVPIGNRAARGAEQEAEGLAAAAQSEADALRLQIQREAALELRDLQVAQQRVAWADQRVAALTQALQAEEAALAQGGSHPEIVLAQRRELTLARVEALRARTDWRTAESALLALQGKLAP